ncbi:MAG: DUF4271 domain-containing protein [Alistipes sp.]|jgi:hypothetical protein|nr:DUF4271 domain-containing protein [Alistipes sp.]
MMPGTIYGTVLPATMESIPFQMLSLTIGVIYCWMIYYYRAQVAECFRSLLNFTSGESSSAGNKRLYVRFLYAATSLGALSSGMVAAKWMAAGGGTFASGTGVTLPGGTFFDADALQWMGSWLPACAALAVALIVAVIVRIEGGALRAAGSLTLSTKVTDWLLLTKRNMLAAASMLLVPLALVWTGANPARDMIVAYLIMGVTVAVVVLFVIHTLRGFVKQKISLLVWFLYLCTVEIFPVSAVVLAAMRNA